MDKQRISGSRKRRMEQTLDKRIQKERDRESEHMAQEKDGGTCPFLKLLHYLIEFPSQSMCSLKSKPSHRG